MAANNDTGTHHSRVPSLGIKQSVKLHLQWNSYPQCLENETKFIITRDSSNNKIVDSATILLVSTCFVWIVNYLSFRKIPTSKHNIFCLVIDFEISKLVAAFVNYIFITCNLLLLFQVNFGIIIRNLFWGLVYSQFDILYSCILICLL